MKIPSRRAWLVVFLTLAAWPLWSAEPAVAAEEKIPPERLQLKVERVYAAAEGAARFRAYVVKWKGQEVVVSDGLAQTDYKVGDTITVLAMNHPFPQGREDHRLLAFVVMPPRPGRP